MTPMVDVAFLLLIFFMSTTQFKPPEQVAVSLPLSRSEIHVPETGTIILTVNKTGQIFISEREGHRSPGPGARTTSWTPSSTGAAATPTAVVVVKGDRDAPFGAMADLMDALAQAKTLRFNLMTDLKKRTPLDAAVTTLNRRASSTARRSPPDVRSRRAGSGNEAEPATGVLGRAKKKRVGVRIDMTPMVDVAFLLLIFFMVTTVFRRPLAMEVNLPEPGAKVEVPESNVMTVYVDRDESLFFKTGQGPHRAQAPGTISAATSSRPTRPIPT